MKWYVGQRVVCIKTHSERIVIKDCTYTIHGISECRCGLTCIDVGFLDVGGLTHCDCGRYIKGACWVGDELLLPFNELSDYTVETLLNEIEEPVKVKV